MPGVRQKDIAEQCGVSQEAVAFALSANPRLQRKLSAATRERVQQAARRLGYVPHQGARSLRNGKTHTIGLATWASIIHPFFSESIEALHVAFAEQGYHMVIELLYATADEAGAYRAFASGRYDGVVIQGLAPSHPLLLRLLRRAGLPVVVSRGYIKVRGVSTVNGDNREATRMGVEHLLARGRRQIALVYDAEKSIAQTNRLAGYRAALSAAGVALDRTMLFPCAVQGTDPNELWARIAAAHTRPSAVYSYNAELAAGLLRAIRANGLKVPDDVALVTHTNPQLAAQMEVPLTTVDVDKREMARTVVTELLSRIDNPRQAPRHIMLQPVLTARESSLGSVKQS